MVKRSVLWAAAMAILTAAPAFAEEPLKAQRRSSLVVCLTLSDALEIGEALRTGVIGEANRIWQPLGVRIGLQADPAAGCERWVLVKSDREAGPRDGGGETAIAWVPFVAGRARRVVFVRVSHARMLIEAFHPTAGIRPSETSDLLLTRLLGRSLAHEIGHVLLNSLAHDKSGLMRARYGADDVLRDLPSAYTLSAQQSDRLFQ